MAFTLEQDRMVRDFLDVYDIPGAAVAIVRGSTIVAEGGFGLADVDRALPATAHTVWPICSLTKSFTAVAAMQLVESQKLLLDAPVQTYLPGFRISDTAASERITSRLFLTHSSGLGRTGHQDRTREEQVNPYPTRKALVDALDSATLQSAPGVAFSYCNEGFATVGHAIETIAGVTLEEYFQRGILDRVGMQDSSVHFMDWKNATDRTFAYSRAVGDPFDSGERHGEYTVIRLNDDYQTFLSTGGIVSSAHDLALYQIASMNYDRSPLDLTVGSLDHMQSVQHPFGDTGWGYGLGYWVFWSGDVKVVGHSGGLPGISTYSMMIPSERSGIVVLTNRGDRPAFFLAEHLMNNLRGAVWRESTNQSLPFVTRHPKRKAKELAEYEGEYVFRSGTARVEAVDGGLLIHAPSRLEGRPLAISTAQVGPDSFMSTDEGLSIAFIRDRTGQILRFLNGGYAYERS